MLDHTRHQFDLAEAIGEVLHELAALAFICFFIGVVLSIAAVLSGVM
jgi:hypothetical protein